MGRKRVRRVGVVRGLVFSQKGVFQGVMCENCPNQPQPLLENTNRWRRNYVTGYLNLIFSDLHRKDKCSLPLTVRIASYFER